MKQWLYLFSVIYVLGTSFGFCQSTYVDSLKSEIITSKDDTVKVQNLLLISQNLALIDNPNAIHYANRAKELSESLSYSSGIANSLKWIGIAYYYNSENLVALQYFERAFEEFAALGDKSGMANMLSLQGSINTNEGDEARGLELQFQALTLLNEVDDEYRKASVLVNIGNGYADKESSIDKAIEFYLQALPIFEELERPYEIGNVAANIGDAYYVKNELNKALLYYNESLEAYDGKDEMAYKLLAIGKVYAKREDFARAISTIEQANKIAVENGYPLDIAKSLIALGDTYKDSKNYQKAINQYLEAIPFIETDEDTEAEYKNEMRSAYDGLSFAYAQLGNYQKAFEYQERLTSVKDVLYESANQKKMDLINANFENDQQRVQISLQEANLQQEKIQKNAFFGGFVLIFIIAFVIYRNYRNKVKTNKLLDKQNEEIEGLLLNILPEEVAHELQHEGYATPKDYESSTILFTDFKGFTKISSGLLPHELIAELNSYFNEFDDIIEKYNLEKIKTIGDAYMCAGGIPSANTTHPIDAVEAGLAMQKYIKGKNERRKADGLVPWELRVGIHTGHIVAGVVGRKKYAYDIWGDAVNIASRMESNGEACKVNISETTYQLVKHKFNCTHRGQISVKGAGEKDMYFVDGPKELAIDLQESSNIEVNIEN